MSETALAANPDLVEDLIAAGRITAENVLVLRRELFADGVITAEEADTVFRLDQACEDKDETWGRFFVDALTDYFVWQSVPRKYVDESAAGHLIRQIAADGRVDSASELELLINIVHWAESCPETLALTALEAVKSSVLDPDRAAYGKGRMPEVIDQADVELIRKVIYAGGGAGGFTVTRAEAELLFALNRASNEDRNAAGWRDLFVKALAGHLMFPRGAPQVVSAEERSRREAWLEERRGVGTLLGQIGKSVMGLDVGQAWQEVDPFGKRGKAETESKEAARTAEASAREAVDAAEARWLIERLDEDGTLSGNERALLGFIKETSPRIDESLEPVMASAGL